MDDERGRKKLAIIILLLLLIAAAAAIWLSQGEDEQTWKVTVEVEGQGTADPMEAAIEDGGTLTIQLTPAEGWELSEVYLDGELTNFAGREFTISDIREDHKVRAVFVEIVPVPTSYTLTVVSNDGGSTDPTGESVRSVGEKVRVSAVPDEGSVIGDVRVDGTSVGAMNVLDVEMDSDHTVEFVFREASSTGENTDPVVTIDVDVVVTLRTTGADAETSGSSAASFGTIAPSGKVRVAYGGSLTITMTLNEGYALVSVTAGGKSIEPAPEFTVKDITSDVGIAIVVSGPTFSIVSSAGTGGSISPSGETLVLIGSSQTYTISPSSGYRISSVTVDGIPVGAVSSYTFSGVATDHSISASFVRSSTPSPSPGPSPGPTPSTPTLTSLTVTGAPTAVYVGDAPDFSRMTVTAVYSDGSTRALSSSQYTISPDPSVPIAEAGTYTYTVSYGGISKDIQVVATVQQFTVTITAGTGGTVSQTTLTVDRGTEFTTSEDVLTVGTTMVTAAASPGYDFSGWSPEGGTVSVDTTIAAEFVLHTYEITVVQPTVGGTVSASAETGRMGDTISLTATPDTGYQLKEWSVTGATVADASPETTITVGTSDIVISAVFEPIPIIVTVVADGDGSVSPSPISTVYGKTLTVSGSTLTVQTTEGPIDIMATPTSPSVFSKWTVDGNDLTIDMTLTQNVTVNAVFASLESISIESEPSQNYVYYDETLDPSGLEIKAAYADGTTGIIPWTSGGDVSVSPLSGWTSAGSQTVTVSYGGKDSTFTTLVPTLNSISVIGTTSYEVGSTITSDDIVVTASYGESGIPTRTVTGYMMDQPDMTSAGDKTLKVSYTEGSITKTDVLSITVAYQGIFSTSIVSVEGRPVSGQQSLGEYAWDITGMVPGDSRTIVVKVSSSEGCAPCIILSSLTGDTELAEWIDVSWDAGTSGSTTLGTMTADPYTSSLGTISAGGTMTVTITVSMSEDAPPSTMGMTLGFTLGIGTFGGTA